MSVRAVTAAIALPLASLAAGCATIVASGPDAMLVTSEPVGAEVRIDDQVVGSTPVTPMVRRSANIVTLRKEGYEEGIRPIPRSVNPWVFGNILIGGLIGITVDAVTGNAEKADGSLHVDLRPAAGVALTVPSQQAASPAEPQAAAPAQAEPEAPWLPASDSSVAATPQVPAS